MARDAVEKTWSFQQQQQQKQLPQGVEEVKEEEESSTPPSCQSLLNPRRQVVVAGVLSPVADSYQKAGLASAASRCRLARLACASTSDWLAVDSWEASRSEWTPTRVVLEHAQRRLQLIAQQLGGKVSEAEAEIASESLEQFEDPLFGGVPGWFPFQFNYTNLH